MANEEQIYNYLGSLRIYLSDDYSIEAKLKESGAWENHVVVLLQHFIKSGFMCVDVGANSGIHTLLLSELVGEEGHVVAFEPSPDYSQRLINNLKLNQSLAARVEVFREGVSDYPGNLKLFASGDKKGNSYLSEEYDELLWNTHGPEVYEVCPVVTLDDKLKDRKVDLIKIDVEGMEHRVLAGAANLIRRHAPIIVYETLVECFAEEKLLAAQQLLKSFGYFNFYQDPKFKKLLIARYPVLPEDCIALHPRRMLSAASIMHNSAQYFFGCAESIKLFGAPKLLTVVGVNRDSYCIAFHDEGDKETEMILCEREKDTLKFVQNVNSLDFACHASVFKLPIDLTQAMQSEDASVILRNSKQEFKLRGQLRSGVLYHY